MCCAGSSVQLSEERGAVGALQGDQGPLVLPLLVGAVTFRVVTRSRSRGCVLLGGVWESSAVLARNLKLPFVAFFPWSFNISDPGCGLGSVWAQGLAAPSVGLGIDISGGIWGHPLPPAASCTFLRIPYQIFQAPLTAH